MTDEEGEFSSSWWCRWLGWAVLSYKGSWIWETIHLGKAGEECPLASRLEYIFTCLLDSSTSSTIPSKSTTESNSRARLCTSAMLSVIRLRRKLDNALVSQVKRLRWPLAVYLSHGHPPLLLSVFTFRESEVVGVGLRWRPYTRT